MNTGRIASAFASGGCRLAIAGIALLCTVVAALTLNLPALSGRVVDQANIIAADTRNAVVSAMDGHVLGKAVLVARFHR